jgi:hypothetical protein
MSNGYTPDSPEQWRPIAGFPDYSVSSHGRVVSYKRKTPYLMGGSHNQRGYRMVMLTAQDGKKTIRTVHRLVAAAFLGPTPEGLQVCHNDGDKERNGVDNLRFDTPSANILDQVAHGRHFWANKTHCPQGHEYSPDNTYRIPSTGSRMCRTCNRDRQTNRAFRAAGIEAAA